MELISEIFRWYNLPYTILLMATLLYWLIVIIGVFDFDTFDFAAEGSPSIDWLNINHIPFSLWFSIFILQLWAYSILWHYLLDQVFQFAWPEYVRFLTGLVILIPAASVLTKLFTSPLNRFFDTRDGISNSELEGKTCIVTSSEVTATFGTGQVKLTGAPIILNIRCDEDEHLFKNQRALIYKYDEEQKVYFVTKAVD